MAMRIQANSTFVIANGEFIHVSQIVKIGRTMFNTEEGTVSALKYPTPGVQVLYLELADGTATSLDVTDAYNMRSAGVDSSSYSGVNSLSNWDKSERNIINIWAMMVHHDDEKTFRECCVKLLELE